MLNLVIFGAPGAGKGTQAMILSEKYNLKHLSTGEMFRQEIKKNTNRGKKIEHYLSTGDLVPDEITIDIVKNSIKENNYQGFIFDGFPRTIKQAESLDEYLKEYDEKVDLIIILDTPKEILISRLSSRAKESQRKDDSNGEIIKNRLTVYQEKTFPLINYYKKQGKVVSINGVGNIENISQKISKEIDRIKSMS